MASGASLKRCKRGVEVTRDLEGIGPNGSILFDYSPRPLVAAWFVVPYALFLNVPIQP